MTLCHGQIPFEIMPANTFGVEGQNITLTCAIDRSVVFYWKNPFGDRVAQNEVGDTGGVADGFENDYALVQNFGINSWSLVIINAGPTDAGQYECEVPIPTYSAFAEVFVMSKCGVCLLLTIFFF